MVTFLPLARVAFTETTRLATETETTGFGSLQVIAVIAVPAMPRPST